MIRVGSKVSVYFHLRALHNLTVEYEPQQPNDCWIFKKETGEEIRVMSYDSIEEKISRIFNDNLQRMKRIGG